MGKSTDFNCSSCGGRHEHVHSGKGSKVFMDHGSGMTKDTKSGKEPRGFFGQKKK